MIQLNTGKKIGAGAPTYIIAEIGINHNGSLAIAKSLIDEAAEAGCSAVKFQKRTPELCVPFDQRHIERDTPWGRMTYLEYRYKVEFGEDEYAEIDRYCREKGIDWFASCWDEEAVDFIGQFNPPLYKAASASLTDFPLLEKMKSTGKPLIISTGMSTMQDIDLAVEQLGVSNLLIAHSTSAYPCPLSELNLKMLQTLRSWFPQVLIGYSGHETGLATTVAAVALGACFVERHVTLDRAMWGSDQAASVEPTGMRRLVKDIRSVEESLGDGIKRVYESEMGARKKLRRTTTGAATVSL
ncbi:MAG: N-acetylneuraminate synthase family protein [Saprospirales bacterium]|nr:N-acetylneuraminate synthase family protein [Saprospirales bacterium]MBK8921782.1 N-acetylneuraminate synthase family protein [Saprospirales bacterium]